MGSFYDYWDNEQLSNHDRVLWYPPENEEDGEEEDEHEYMEREDE